MGWVGVRGGGASGGGQVSYTGAPSLSDVGYDLLCRLLLYDPGHGAPLARPGPPRDGPAPEPVTLASSAPPSGP